jgi:membrane-associated phospholipid phosphatase
MVKNRTTGNKFDHYLLIIILALALIGLAMSICAALFGRFPGDLGLILLLQSIDNSVLQSVMKFVSYDSNGWLEVQLIFLFSVLIWWRLGILEGAITATTGLYGPLSLIFKLAIDRPRPTPDIVQVKIFEPTSAFPSGHAMFAILFLGLLAYFAFIHLRRPALRIVLPVCCIVLIILIGLSRVYLGVHWPSDVLGGYIIGGVFLGLLIYAYRVLRRHFYNNYLSL